LTYTINFQNTGNAPAFNIRLEDTISNLLDLNTFEMINASHVNHFKIINNKLTVYFPNIMLDDSTTNLEGSKGMFQYRIKPLSAYPVNTQINNTAYIYFDYNSPIVTNTAQTDYLVNTSGISSNKLNLEYKVYPNPTNDLFFVKGQSIKTVTVYDELGKQIEIDVVYNSNIAQIKLNDANAGLFIVRIETLHGVKFEKILIK